MVTLRPFTCDDLFRFNSVNLDPLTETYGISFYLQYLAHWPELFQVAVSPSGEIMGYIMGKAEGTGENWHGHVTALTVGPDFRRLGIAASLMAFLEEVSEHTGTFLAYVYFFFELPKLKLTNYKIIPMEVIEEIALRGGLPGSGDKGNLGLLKWCPRPNYWLPARRKRAYFVDLFVRVSNLVAINMYKQLGYIVYRTVLDYYAGDPDEDAYDMRKACSRDVAKKSVIPLDYPVRSEEVD